jgi:hypothetical protein
MDTLITCPVCDKTFTKASRFCSECGCNLSNAESVTINPPIGGDKFVRNLRNRVKNIGEKAQKEFSGASAVILDRASNVSSGTDNVVVQQKVSEAVASLVNLMVNVSRDVKLGLSSDVINAVDLSARVNFVAFSVGVSVDLASLKENIDSKARMEHSQDRVP